jgi:hypothetical protein
MSGLKYEIEINQGACDNFPKTSQTADLPYWNEVAAG